MTEPVRIQMKREKGFNLQEHSKAINGLPAIRVDRATKWGNPFKPGEEYVIADDDTATISVSSDKMEGIVHFYEIAIRGENVRKHTKECPFCGAKAYPNMRATSGRPVHTIACAVCTANVWANSCEAALRIWNRRADERKSAEAEKATCIQTDCD